jgi:hypothetical protein
MTSGPISQDEYMVWLEANLWRPSRVVGLEVPLDTSPAEWIGDALSPATFEVRMMVPDGFQAYARVFFPFAAQPVYRDGRQVDNERFIWTEVASANCKTAHALMEAETISTGSAYGGGTGLYGSFSEEQEDALWPILERHTTSLTGWFLRWDGFGGLDPRPFEAQPKVEHGGRSYHLLHGALGARAGFDAAPSYVWPDDRAWCLTRDIDWYWAYTAGTTRCVDDIVATHVLDAYVTEPSNRAQSGMDIINDPHGIVPRRL